MAERTQIGKAWTSSGQVLFVASATPYFVDAYALPLSKNSVPVISVQDVDEPVPLAVGTDHLFVGSFSDGTVLRFKLPLTADESAETLPLALGAAGAHAYRSPLGGGVGNAATTLINMAAPSGLALGPKFLYVAGARPNGRYAIAAYPRPITPGESPTSTISGFSATDFLGLALADGTLYVASTEKGTIDAYSVPLRKSERPRFSVNIGPQMNAAIGIAVRDAIYVTDYSTGEILVYSLTQTGPPIRLDMKPANGGTNPLPYAVTLSADSLYVTASGSIYQYPLPIVAGEMPSAIVSTKSFLTGVAVFPKW